MIQPANAEYGVMCRPSLGFVGTYQLHEERTETAS